MSYSPQNVAGKFSEMTLMKRVRVVQQMMRQGVSEVVWQGNSEGDGFFTTSRDLKEVVLRLF